MQQGGLRWGTREEGRRDEGGQPASVGGLGAGRGGKAPQAEGEGEGSWAMTGKARTSEGTRKTRPKSLLSSQVAAVSCLRGAPAWGPRKAPGWWLDKQRAQRCGGWGLGGALGAAHICRARSCSDKRARAEVGADLDASVCSLTQHSEQVISFSWFSRMLRGPNPQPRFRGAAA